MTHVRDHDAELREAEGDLVEQDGTGLEQRSGPREGRSLMDQQRQLQALERPMESDVFVCGMDPAAKVTVGGLIDRIPNLRWVDAGDLTMARIAETMTALLISVNRTYKLHDAGFRVTGRDAWGKPGP